MKFFPTENSNFMKYFSPYNNLLHSKYLKHLCKTPNTKNINHSISVMVWLKFNVLEYYFLFYKGSTAWVQDHSIPFHPQPTVHKIVFANVCCSLLLRLTRMDIL